MRRREGALRRLGAAALVPTALALASAGCFGVGRGGGSDPERAEEPRAPIAQPGSPEWEQSSAPLVRAYLSTLPESALGQPLSGIKLSDGRRWFEGDTLLARPRDVHEGLEVFVLLHEGKPMAIMWLAEGSAPYALPQCEGDAYPSVRARRLSGQVHTWKSLHPEHGIVYTECPPEAWIPEARRGSSAAPGSEGATE